MNTLDHKVVFQKSISKSSNDLILGDLNKLQTSASNTTAIGDLASDPVLDQQKNIVWAVSWRPDGRKLAVSTKNTIALYDFIHDSLEYADQFSGPTGTTVTAIAWSGDCRQLAFGSTVHDEKNNGGNGRAPVVIYELNSDSNTYRGKLKFHHDQAIQCLAYQPNVTHNQPNRLVTCSVEDYSMWDSSTSQVHKANVESKIVCLDWHSSGQLLAMGFHSGRISIRDGNTEDLRERYRIDRPSNGPIWSIKFKRTDTKSQKEKELQKQASQTTPEPIDMDNTNFAFVDWGRRLCYCNLKGIPSFPEVHLPHDPTFLEWHDQDTLLVGDMGGALNVYTATNGSYIKTLHESDSWITAGAVHPRKRNGSGGGKSELVAICDKIGQLSLISTSTSNISAIHKKLYASCEKMTSVVIKNLSDDRSMRIQCNELVLGIALNRRLCTILTKTVKGIRLTTWELIGSRYEQRKQVSLEGISDSDGTADQKAVNLNVIGCTNRYLLVRQGKHVIKSFFLDTGMLDREWKFQDPIVSTTLTVSGDTYLACEKEIFRLSLNNVIPIPILKVINAIKSIRLSVRSNYLAIQYADNRTLQVYQLDLLENSSEILWQEPNVTSFMFHDTLDTLVAYTKSEESQLQIREIGSPAVPHPTAGAILAFCESKVYTAPVVASEKAHQVNATEVHQSTLLKQMVESGKYETAFSLASLGVTMIDWRYLAEKALLKSTHQSLEIARRSYTQLNDLIHLSIVEELYGKYMKDPGNATNQNLCRAEACAYLGLFDEAVEAYRNAGKINLARRMYLDLRMFDKAKQFDNVDGAKDDFEEDVQDEAKWAEDNNDIDRAIEIYLNTQNFIKAIDLMGQYKQVDKIIQTARRRLEPEHMEPLLRCVHFIKLLLIDDEKRMFSLCVEFLEKAKLHEELVEILCKKLDWARAHQIAENCKNLELIQKTWLRHATWLAENDQFNAAQKAFIQADKPQEATKVLSELTKNAIEEFRFHDASAYSYKISQNALAQNDMQVFERHQKMALVYYLYDIVYEFAFQPFMTHECDDQVLFHAARWLWFELEADPHTNFENISYVAVLYTLARKATELQSYKVARLAHDKLRSLKLPGKLKNRLEQDALKLFAKPFNDSDDLRIDCPRCDASNQIFPIQMAGLRTFGKDGDAFGATPTHRTLSFCQSCGQTFVMSLASFEVLPVVEFFLDPELEALPTSDVKNIIGSDLSNSAIPSTVSSASQLNPSHDESMVSMTSTISADRLTLTGNDLNDTVDTFRPESTNAMSGATMGGPDLWMQLVEHSQCTADNFQPLLVNRQILSQIKPHEVLISTCKNRETRYFRNLIPDIPLAVFNNCLFGGLASKADVEVLNIFTNRQCPFFQR